MPAFAGMTGGGFAIDFRWLSSVAVSRRKTKRLIEALGYIGYTVWI
jgi:hypothetical protein